MLPVLETVAVAVYRDNMNMQMVHRWMRVYSAHYILLPVPSYRQCLKRRFGIKRLLSHSITARVFSVFSAKFTCSQCTNLVYFELDLFQKFGIVERFDRMETGLFRIAWEEKKVHRGLGEHVLDNDKVVIVVHNDIRRICFRFRDVGA